MVLRREFDDDWSGKKTVKAGQKARNASRRRRTIVSDPSFQGSEMALPSTPAYPVEKHRSVTSKVSSVATSSTTATDAHSTVALNEGRFGEKRSILSDSHDETLEEEECDDESSVVSYQGCGAWASLLSPPPPPPNDQVQKYLQRVKTNRDQVQQQRRKRSQYRRRAAASAKKKEEAKERQKKSVTSGTAGILDDEDYPQIEVVHSERSAKACDVKDEPIQVSDFDKTATEEEAKVEIENTEFPEDKPARLSSRNLMEKSRKSMTKLSQSIKSSLQMSTKDLDKAIEADTTESEEKVGSASELEDNEALDDGDDKPASGRRLMEKSRKSIAKLGKSIKSSLRKSRKSNNKNTEEADIEGTEDELGNDDLELEVSPVHESSSDQAQKSQLTTTDNENYPVQESDTNQAHDNETSSDDDEINTIVVRSKINRAQIAMLKASQRSLSNIGQSLKYVGTAKLSSLKGLAFKSDGEGSTKVLIPRAGRIVKKSRKTIAKASRAIRSHSLSRAQSLSKIPESLVALTKHRRFSGGFASAKEIQCSAENASCISSVVYRRHVKGHDKYYVPNSDDEETTTEESSEQASSLEEQTSKNVLDRGHDILTGGLKKIKSLRKKENQNDEEGLSEDADYFWISEDNEMLENTAIEDHTEVLETLIPQNSGESEVVLAAPTTGNGVAHFYVEEDGGVEVNDVSVPTKLRKKQSMKASKSSTSGGSVSSTQSEATSESDTFYELNSIASNSSTEGGSTIYELFPSNSFSSLTGVECHQVEHMLSLARPTK